LVGVRFRLHGRGPTSGLDCVGLVAASYTAAGHDGRGVPDDYRMRDVSILWLEQWLRVAGFYAVMTPAVGDVVVSDMGRGQFHLSIAGDGACVHAHAGLRRVVMMPGLPGVAIGRWRVMPGDER
jgi:cell wall-associated NlpC family hydrolase